jgi:ketosteroid isomerase-like protein
MRGLPGITVDSGNRTRPVPIGGWRDTGRTMSQNVEALRRVYEGWERGDFTTSEPLMEKNIVLVVTPSFPTEGVWVGLDGMKEHTAQVLDVWESLTMAAEEYREAGDSVLVRVRQRGVGAGSGVSTEMHYFQLWSFRGGKAIRLEVIADEADALEVLGVSE